MLSSMAERLGEAAKAQNAAVTSVTSSQAVQVSHAFFFFLPLKLETVSHPVRAWKNGNPRHLLGPSATAISWAARTWSSFLCLRQPRAHQCPDVQLLSLQKLHQCLLCGSTLCCIPTSQHLQHGVAFLYQHPRGYKGQGQQHLGPVYKPHLCGGCWWLLVCVCCCYRGG